MVSNKALQVLIDFIIVLSLPWLHVSVFLCYFLMLFSLAAEGRKLTWCCHFCTRGPLPARGFLGSGKDTDVLRSLSALSQLPFISKKPLYISPSPLSG